MMPRVLLSLPVQVGLASLLSLVLGWVWFFGIRAEEELLLDRSGRVNDARRSLQQTQQIVDSTSELLQIHAHNRKEIQYFRDTYLSSRDERIRTISAELFRLAQEHEVSMNQVRYVNQARREQGLDVVRVSFPLIGHYHAIRAFLGALERGHLFVSVEQLEVQGVPDQGGQVQAQLALAAFLGG